MEFIKKYLLFFLLIENDLAHTRWWGMEYPFYIIIVLGLLFLFRRELYDLTTFKCCKGLFLLSFVYVFYEFTAGLETITTHNLMYLVAKVSTLIIIAICVTSNFEFYFKKNILYTTILMIAFIVFGMLFGIERSERLELGFGNPNALSMTSAMAFGGILYYYDRLSFLKILLLTLCVYGTLAGGSRNGMVVLVFFALMRYGKSLKVLPIAVFFIFAAVEILPSVGLKTVGVERFVNTISGEVKTNRDIERKAAWMMIKKKPYTGWGLDAKNVGAARAISEMGSHNGYLEMLKFMGYPFFFLWLITLLISVIPLLRLYFIEDNYIRYHVIMLGGMLFATFYEGYLIGVHELVSNTFFTSLAVLSTYRYKYLQGEIDYCGEPNTDDDID